MINLNIGQKLAFRKDYEQEFDGSTSYSYRNSFPTNTATFSLYLFATPTVDASRQVLFSVGTKGSSVLFEIGISTSDKVFAYDGTTEVEVGETLVSGTLYNITVVYTNELITLYVNNELYATGLGLGDEGIDIVVGDSVLGSAYYEGGLTNVSLFVEEHTRGIAQMVTGYGSSPTWSPADLFVGAGGLWLDASDSSYLTRATQPVVVNGDFELGSTGWALGADWSINGGQAHHASGGAGAGILNQAVAPLITGNHYNATQVITAVTGGGPLLRFGNTGVGGYKTVPGTYTDDETGSGTSLNWYTSTGTACSIESIVIENLSLTAATPRAGTITSDFEQATAATQPWTGGSRGNGFHSSGADYLTSSAPKATWNFLHDGTGSTWWAVVKPDTLVNNSYIFGNGAVGSTAYGFGVDWYLNGSIRPIMANGTGSWCFITPSAAGILSDGTTTILIGRDQTGSNYEVYAGGTKVIDVAPVGVRSTADATNALNVIKSTAAGSPAINGSLLSFGTLNIRVSDSELELLGAYLRDNVGGTWV